MKAILAVLLVWGAAAAAELKHGVVGPDDTVTITALNAEEISKAWRVGPSGELNLPMVGQIKAGGLTVEQLTATITERLKKYVKDPQVTVFVSDYKSHPVTVTGAVDKPGVLQLDKPTPLFAVLALAGGLKDPGTTITITRQIERGPIPNPEARESADGKFSILEYPVQDVLRGHGDAANIEIQPFDSITVSQEKHPRMVFLAGEFNKPGAIELQTQDTVSLTKALAMAGGLTHTAAPGKTMIRHINDKGVETAFGFVDIRKILQGKAKDLTLSEGDVVIVPNSQLSTYLQTMSTTAITSSVYILGKL